MQAYSSRTRVEHPLETPSGSPGPKEALYVRIPGEEP